MLIRTRQPGALVGINRANPLTLGLIGVYGASPSAPLVNAAYPRKRMTAGGSGSVLADRPLGQAFSLGGSGYFQDQSFSTATTAGRTMACWVRLNSLPASEANVIVWTDGTSVLSIEQLRINPSGTVTVESYRAGTAGVATTSGAVTVGKWHFVAAVMPSDASRTAWLDNESATANTSASVNGTDTYLTIGAAPWSGYGGTVDGDILLPMVWNRGLSDAEIRELRRNPWQLFAPIDDTIPFSYSSVGGSTTVTVDSASIVLSGQSVTASTSVPVTASALSLTGSSVPLTQTIAVDSSAITLTGQSVTNTTTIPVTAGSVTLTGSEISVTVGGDTTVTVDSGTLSLTGQTVTNTVSVPVSAASITLSGQTITGTTIIPVTAGTVSLTGGDITITYSGPSTTTVSVDPASLILVGQSIDVSYSGRTGGGAAKAKLKKKKRKFQTQTPDETLEALVEQLKEDKKPVLKQVKEIVEEVKELIEESSEDNDKEESEEKHETLETTTVMFFVASLINKTNEAVETMQRFETKLGRLEASLKKIEQSARNAEELALLLYSER